MKLYWCPRTRAVRVVWILEELGAEYERIPVDIRDPEGRRDPEFLATSPLGKVPALEDNGVQVADSAAICLYLADRYGAGRLAPATDDPDRGRFLFWMFFAPGAVEPAMAEKAGGWAPNRGAHGWGDFDAVIGALENGLSRHPWILGASFSAADVMLGSSVVFLRAFGMLPASPMLEAYADRCLARPGYQRALALDEAGGV
jgi:glutathione S-transferase